MYYLFYTTIYTRFTIIYIAIIVLSYTTQNKFDEEFKQPIKIERCVTLTLT